MNKSLSKTFSVITILALMLMALPVQGAQAISTTIVISEFRTRGPSGGSDEFIELYNLSSASVDISGWKINGSNASGSVSTRVTIPSGTLLGPGCRFLATNSNTSGGPYSGSVAGDQTYATGITDDGGIALLRPDNSIVDAVGMSSGSAYKEGTTLTPTTTNAERSYERKPGGGTDNSQDTDDNAADFILNSGTSNPQNSSSACTGGGGAPNLSINDASADEGNSGTTSFDFTVSLSAPAGPGGVTFDIATADGTATVADNDYVANSLTGETIPEGSTTYAFSVLVNGDTAAEPDETFFVNVTNVSGASIADGQGQGTIINDDASVCTLSYTPIYSIQGSGLSAAITGNVTTQGVVVGDFEGSTGLQGFYLQDMSGDGDTATSDGIFVFTGSSDLVSVGQVVRVTGYARERFNQTALNGTNSNTSPVTDIVDCGSTASLTPVDVTMPFDSSTYLERFEGMLVRFPQALVVSEYFNYDRFGEIVLGLPLDGETRLFTPTGVVEPGSPAQARAEAYSLRRITLDDGLGIQNPSVTRHPNGDPFTLNNRFRGGDTVQNTVGVLGFDFSLYRIQPTAPADYTAANPRPAHPADVGGRLKVASFNVLNYFTTLDNAGPICGPAANQDCRGADNAGEFTRQRDKIIAALSEMNADVVGLIEIENHPGDVPTADLVSGLNDELGAGTYDYIATGAIGTDAIRVAFIYKPSTVTPIGAYAILDSSVDSRFNDDKNRPALAQTFEENATGRMFTAAVNHLKSKGSACDDVGDPDVGDGAGNCNLTRKAAAEALVDWLATDPTGSGDEDFLIIGDLNSYDKEDPIDAIREGSDDSLGTGDDYTDLLFHFLGEYAYSYVFDGQAGYLDHALANAALVDEVTGVTVWHINADEPDLLDYDTTFKSDAQDALYAPDAYRSSDHDPVIVGLNLTYDFTGFFPPIQNPPAFNVVKAGQGVPVKFSLNGDFGLDVIAAGYPKSQPIACPSATDPTNGLDETGTAGSSGLSYDPLTDTYTYVWKTNKSWANTCRQFVLKLDDGTVHIANFQFTK